ncbi:MAG: hypothetical protein ABR978_05275 [Dehalococcoidia bacterium]|jgi:hypothetical protein
MPRGGRRPGAGAPRGNLNALRTGAHSKQLSATIGALLSVPETRGVMLALIDQKRRDRERFQQIIVAAAKLIHDTELSESIRQKLEQQIRKTLTPDSENC